MNNKKIRTGILLLFLTFCACFLVYRTQIREKLSKPVTATLKLVRKPNLSVELSEGMPELAEVFRCETPRLKQVRVECKAENIAEGAALELRLADAQTGEEYAQKTVTGDSMGSEEKEIRLDVSKKGMEDSEGRLLCLTVRLTDAAGTTVQLTGNRKPGIVQSMNGDEANKTNVISRLQYANCKSLFELYVLLCAALMLFVGLAWYLLICREQPLAKAYVPLALTLGVIFNFVIMVHGVPDEPFHIGTAYLYSNMLMGVGETGNAETVYMRQCDAVVQDMLKNGVESSSYYQLRHHFFELPENTELVEGNLTRTDYLAPPVVFVPSALGITVGRLLGLSGLMTFSLGRLFALAAYVLLTAYAVWLLPYGKNALSAALLLPISMQQAASCSYDTIINAFLFVFVALCFYEAKRDGQKQISKREIFRRILLIFLAGFIAITKGGVYTPLYLLLIPALWNHRRNREVSKPVNKKKLAALAAAGVFVLAALFAVMFWKFWPMLSGMFETGTAGIEEDPKALYNIPYFMAHPARLIYVYWRTLMKYGDSYLRGMLGGLLEWLEIKIPWMILIGFLLCMILLAHVDGDRYQEHKGNRVVLALAAAGVTAVTILSMLLAMTKMKYPYAVNVQGRYLFVIWPLLLCLLSSDMIHVKKKQAGSVAMTMMMLEMMTVLCAVTKI